MPEPTSASPGELSRFQLLVNLFKAEAVNRTASVLDSLVSPDLPSGSRKQLIQSTADELISRHLRNLSTTPDLTNEEAKQQAIDQATQQAMAELEDNQNPISIFFTDKTRQQIAAAMQQDPDAAYQAAQAAHQAETARTKKPTDSQKTAQAILKDKKETFGVDEPKTIDILHHIRNQPEVINNPSINSIKKIIKDLPTHAQDLDITPEVAEQFIQELTENDFNQIQNYTLTTTDPLPRQTPFTPWKPSVNSRTLRQARSLGVSPLALAYAKTGFSNQDPKLSKDLQQQVAHIQQILADPLNPNNKLGLTGTLTAYRLIPQVFLAEKLYQPIYRVHQQAQAKTNTLLDVPFQVYKKADGIYKDCNIAITKFKKSHPLGWLITPRLRAQRLTRYLIFKSSKRRRLYRQTKGFWNKWSPKGISKRTGRWATRTIGTGLAKLGTRLGIKGLASLGAAIIEVGSGIGIPLFIIQTTFGLALGTVKKLFRKLKQEKDAFDQAGIAAKAFQAIFAGLKAIGAFIGGAAGSLLGALGGAVIGFFVSGPVGAIIGGIAGFFIGGSLGTILGWNWTTIAAIPATASTILVGSTGILGGGLTGTQAATLASSTAAVSIAAPVAATALLTQHQLDTVSSAFYLPPEIASQQQTSHCTNEPIPLSFSNSSSSPIARRAWEIVNNLDQGFWCYWNRSPDYPELFDNQRYQTDPFPQDYLTNPVNLFWCSDLVIKAYSETGHFLARALECQPGSQPDCYCNPNGYCYINLINSQYMQNYFTRQNRFTPNGPNVYHSISSGNIIFIKNTAPGALDRTNHVGIVYSINNDVLITVEANASLKTHSFTVANDGSIQALGYFQVIGFGRP